MLNMFNLFNVLGGYKEAGGFGFPQNIEQIEHIEHFPCFKHILIEHKPKGLNILSISPVLGTFWNSLLYFQVFWHLWAPKKKWTYWTFPLF